MAQEIQFCKGGGCTAKLGPGVLSRVLSLLPRGPEDKNLLIGYDSKDDAAVYKVSDDVAIVQTLDFFPPMVEDPYTFGQIAATNRSQRHLRHGRSGKDRPEHRLLPGGHGSEHPGEDYAGRRGEGHRGRRHPGGGPLHRRQRREVRPVRHGRCPSGPDLRQQPGAAPATP